MAGPINAGMLRERIAIQEDTLAYVLGEEAHDWNTVTGWSSIPAMIEPESEFERNRGGRNEAGESVKITVRKDVSITAENRIVWRGLRYQVVGFPRFLGPRRLFQQFKAVHTDVDETLPAGTPSGFLFNNANFSHYIPLT